MSVQPKRQKVFLCMAKKTQYGWMGKLGGADIAINQAKSNPDNLVIYILERPQFENKGYGQQPQQQQRPPYQQQQHHQQARPQQRPPRYAPEPPPQDMYDAADPGPQNEYEPESGDLPF